MAIIDSQFEFGLGIILENKMNLVTKKQLFTNLHIHIVVNSFAISTADFGIAARISDTLAKRKSFIGTPYW